ncbi:glycerophosphodiester phosphodiesterase [Spartinivicinus poritis]|uniref:Glycerophosphodiester phosphodiesterase n=1 Tax=Spartinivicinus poritis TaxID=2994640 RepID=A0ABT5UBZ4_9GAMM|nr:glycerophosphodiester phosphodiesterase [Spartinivicinus sp. A2-2]MDE1462943.1 glycerophosphodiester phosphodiesterase [Spartinivicinus sp. A2-2]
MIKKAILLGVVSTSVLAIGSYFVLKATAKTAPHYPVYDNLPTPAVIAHRGGKGLWPENTLHAFQEAVSLGVDMLELDVRQTKDGQLVVLHDEYVDRTTNGKGSISQLTLAEVKKLDAGFNWTEDNQNFPYRGKGISIPTFQEVLKHFPEQKMIVEIKQAHPAIEQSVCQAIRTTKKENHVIIGSFYPEVLKRFRQICPDIATSASPNEVKLLFAAERLGLSELLSPAASALQIPKQNGKIEVATSTFIKAAHDRQLQVQVWTINDTDTMMSLIANGADGIITDYPNRLLTLMSK